MTERKVLKVTGMSYAVLISVVIGVTDLFLVGLGILTHISKTGYVA